MERAANKSKANGNRKLSRLFGRLAKKLGRCRRDDRCGSFACPQCARAFQRAKVAAQKQIIKETANKSSPKPNSSKKSADAKSQPAKKILVMATVVPLHLRYTPADLLHLDIGKRTRWLKEVLTKAGLTQMMVGSADIGWEYRRNKHYYQLHWHLAMWTEDPEKLQKQLLRCFPPKNTYDRPVVVTKSFSLSFLQYINKAIKLPDLLRRNQRGLPHLLFALDRTAPLDLMVVCGLRLSAQSGRLALRPFGQCEPLAQTAVVSKKHADSAAGSIWSPFRYAKP